jgi:hypothetical protein
MYPLEVAFALTEMGCRMYAQRVRRERPDASEAEVDAAVRAWMHSRPGAPCGDGDGRAIAWPRSQ